MGNKTSIFGYTSDAKREPSESWARKIGRSLKAIYVGDNASVNNPNTEKSGLDSSTGHNAAHADYAAPNVWRVHNARKTIFMDINQMDDEDELVSTALDIIADFAVGYDEDGMTAFRVVAKNAKIQKILDDLVRRLDLQNEVLQIVRDMVKHGNEMREVIIDRKKMQIVGLKQTISYQIYPKVNEYNEKVPGWLYVQEKDLYNGLGGKELEEWQILPFCYGAKRGYLVVPMLSSARKNWQRLAMIEDGMATARLVRAYDRLVHKIPVNANWTPQQIQDNLRKYKEAISKRKMMSSEGDMNQVENPVQVQTDFYLPDMGDDRGGIDVLNSTNLQLGNLNDIYYHRERLLARLRVPIAYLQIMSTQKTHLKSGAVGDADIMFSRLIRGIHAILQRGLRRLFDMELVLQGEGPADAYEIHLTRVSTDNLMELAKIKLTNAQAAAYFVEAFGALPPQLIASMFMELSEDQKPIMEKFLNTHGEAIQKSRIKALETAAEPKIGLKDRMPGDNKGGSGNNNKSRTARSSEQKGTSQSYVDLDEAAELFYRLHQMETDQLRAEGLDIPEIEESFMQSIRQNLALISLADTGDDD